MTTPSTEDGCVKPANACLELLAPARPFLGSAAITAIKATMALATAFSAELWTFTPTSTWKDIGGLYVLTPCHRRKHQTQDIAFT